MLVLPLFISEKAAELRLRFFVVASTSVLAIYLSAGISFLLVPQGPSDSAQLLGPFLSPLASTGLVSGGFFLALDLHHGRNNVDAPFYDFREGC